jgi:MFS family permease
VTDSAPGAPVTKSAAKPAASAVLANRDYAIFLGARFISSLAIQMQSVAVGWQIFSVTHRSLDLGLVGLAQFFPAIGLSLVTGHVADRFDRRRIVLVTYLLYGLVSLALVGLARRPDLGTAPVYAVLFCLGAIRAFSNPAGQALLPNLVPAEQFRSAVAWSSTAWQFATIIGPGLGGLLIKPIGEYGVYWVCSVVFLASALVFLFVSKRPPLASGKPTVGKGISIDALSAGIRYVWQNKMVLGAISLDLFAVLLGGAVALMPAFAQDILFVGPNGMGALRSAPSLGAAVVAIVLAYYPLKKRAGLLMFGCVFLFGVATIVFGLSHSFLLSLLALVVVGATDMVSVVIRLTLIQINTPEEVRGRVSAVNMVFIGASNELGEFESGITAQWLGLVPAVVLGGIGTCLVVLAWAAMFPALRKAEGLEGKATT